MPLNTNLVYLAPLMKLLLWGIQWQQLTWQYRTERGNGKLSCLLSTYRMKCGLIQQQKQCREFIFFFCFFLPSWDALRNLLFFSTIYLKNLHFSCCSRGSQETDLLKVFVAQCIGFNWMLLKDQKSLSLSRIRLILTFNSCQFRARNQ